MRRNPAGDRHVPRDESEVSLEDAVAFKRMWKDKDVAISALMRRFDVSRDTIRGEAARMKLGSKV